MSWVGVNFAFQVLPPSDVVRVLRVPLSTVTSALEKPVTFSEKTIATAAVVPALMTVLLN